MSNQLGRLISEILCRYFGSLVQRVGFDLFSYGSKTVVLIAKSTKLPRSQIIECLRALLKYDLVSFEPSNVDTIAEYRLKTDNVLLLLRYPRYLLQIKNKYGYQSEIIIEELLQNGIITATGLINNITNKHKDDKEKNVSGISLRDTIISLVTAGYIKRVQSPVVGSNSDLPIFGPELVNHDGGEDATADVQQLVNALNASNTSDNKDVLYWRVNFDRFHQDFRDELMMKAMSRRIDENAGELMRHLLMLMYFNNGPWVDVSVPILYVDIKESCKRAGPQYPLLVQYLDQYLKVMEENSGGLISRTSDANGGQYKIYMKKSVVKLTLELIDYSVQEKLGSKAARILRLIRSKRYIEEDNIQKEAMLPAKEAKELTYRLMEEHYIKLQPMRRAAAGSSGPAKAIYLYNIDIHQTSCMILEMCYKLLYNCISRSKHERELNTRLIEKQQRVHTIVHGMRIRGEPDENIRDIEETVTPPEQQILETISKMFKKLDTAELELDKTLFILQWYFSYK